MLTLKIDTGGALSQIAVHSQRLERAHNLRVPFEQIGDYLRDEIQQNFASQGRPRWQALSPRYAEWKRQQVGSRPILVFTGRLKASFKHRASANSLVLTNDRKTKTGESLYWKHQLGGGNLPARPMLILGRAERNRISDIVGAYLNG